MPGILEGLSAYSVALSVSRRGKLRSGSRWEARGQEIPVCFPLTKMSKTAAEEMSVAGDPSKRRMLRSYQRVNGRSTVPVFL